MAIQFFSEGSSLPAIKKTPTKEWLASIATAENRSINFLNIIFCNDQYLYSLNKNYLDHDTLTDIITFQYSEKNNPIEGEIFISLDRVKENASIHDAPYLEEIHRVLAHGLLHLCGYPDHSFNEKKIMRIKENLYLRHFTF